MSQMPGKRLSASLIKAYWVQRLLQQGRGSSFLLFGNERMRWAGGGGGRRQGLMDAFAGVCPQSGTAPLPTKRPRTRRSPWPSPRTCQPAPPTSRTTEGKKVSQKCQTMLERNQWKSVSVRLQQRCVHSQSTSKKKEKSLKMSLLKAWLVCKWQKCTPTSSRTHPVGGTW